jgi:hypothetical protein
VILVVAIAEVVGVLTGSYGVVIFVVVMAYGWRQSGKEISVR